MTDTLSHLSIKYIDIVRIIAGQYGLVKVAKVLGRPDRRFVIGLGQRRAGEQGRMDVVASLEGV